MTAPAAGEVSDRAVTACANRRLDVTVRCGGTLDRVVGATDSPPFMV